MNKLIFCLVEEQPNNENGLVTVWRWVMEIAGIYRTVIPKMCH